MVLRTLLLTAALLGAALPTLAAPAAAHVCVLEPGGSCDAECDDQGVFHVHWGDRALPCASSGSIGEFMEQIRVLALRFVRLVT